MDLWKCFNNCASTTLFQQLCFNHCVLNNCDLNKCVWNCFPCINCEDFTSFVCTRMVPGTSKAVIEDQQRFIYVLVIFINSNSIINRHVLLFFIRINASSDSPKKHVVLDCLLSRLQQRGNVVPAWIAHWTTVSLSTARNCPGVSACYTVPACFRQGPQRDSRHHTLEAIWTRS